jgi:hypothetical protein
MPQAPLPAPAARLQAVDLFPWRTIAGTPNPPNVASAQQIPNYMEAMQRGANVGRQMALLPSEVQQEAAKAAYSKIWQHRMKQMSQVWQKAFDDIQKNPQLNPAQKEYQTELLMARTNLGYSGGGPNYSPSAFFQTNLGQNWTGSPPPDVAAQPNGQGNPPAPPANNQQSGVLQGPSDAIFMQD